MIRLWLSFMLILIGIQIFSQTKVTGTVKSSSDQNALFDVTVNLVETGTSVVTDRLGFFQFNDVSPGDYTLEINLTGYDAYIEKMSVTNEPLELGDIFITYNPQSVNIGVITLSSDELASDESSAQSSVGLLQSSRDVFVRTSAFELGAYWFRPRGYDNKYSDVYFNGVRMNKVDNDRVDFGNWGGLNDITRHPAEVTYGLDPSDYSFGDLGGVTYIDTRPSTLRTGTSFSYSLTNRSYRQRLMLTHNTGMTKNGWGLTVSGSRRWAEEGRIEGTFYDAWGYFLGAEKKFNNQHSLQLSIMGAPYRRSTNSPNTQEIYDLMGTGYNAYWGYQNGEKRSERVKNNHEPIGMLTHHWNFNENSKLTTTVGYQTGKNGGSRLDWYNANNPSPIYYRRFPSYYMSLNRSPEQVQNLINRWRNDPSWSQINWDQLYTANANQADGHAVYMLVSDVNEDNTLSFSSTLRTQLSEVFTLYGGVNYQGTKSEVYRELDDLLGAQFAWDRDDFADSGVAGDYDQANPNRKVYEGDKMQYNADYTHNNMNAWANGNFKVQNWDITLGAKIANTSIQREGLMDHYAYNNSLGKSDKHNFLDYGAKLQLLYKINGRNFVSVNGAYFTKAPTINDVFPQGRDNNATIPDLESTKITAGDINYILRAPRLKARATAYYAKTADEVQTAFGYLDLSATSDASLFTAEVLSGVDKQYIGTELAVEAQLTTTITANAVASIGQYTYANNPDLYYFTDDFAELGGLNYSGITYLKDYKLSGTPQQGYSVGLEYRSPKYWWLGTTANYLANNYVSVSPSKRTNQFVVNDYGDVYPEITEASLREILRQEKFSNEFMLNLNAGKSFRFGNYFMIVSANVSNVLNNKNYKTGGFEQLRLADYQVENLPYNRTIFGNRYWYDQGTSYFLNFILRF
ncbi:MAG: carboxypeptidase-like regulatory domain-containing protein [Flavobacteriaceae bacterium]|nr:carboxypeptidase-like regulatory domain-containing protein [Flavobacteriaceae bacterium]